MKTRRHTPEYADAPGTDPAILEDSLVQVAAMNRWLGGDRSLRQALEPYLRSSRTFRLLEVGAGNGTALARMVDWARGLGCDLKATAVDLHPVACRAAGRKLGSQGGTGPSRPAGLPTDAEPPRAQVVRADARSLPFAAGSFDAVMTAQTLHHFRDEEAVRVLRELARVGTGPVVVSDLRRSRLAWAGARFLAATLWRRNPYNRHDGPVSVTKGFTPEELLKLGRQAGLGHLELRDRGLFRLTMMGQV